MAFWGLWIIALLVALSALSFFVIGLADGSVSSFNIGLWAVLLLGVTGATGGSLQLKRAGRNRWATALASLLAVPGLVAVLFLLVVLVSDARWN